MMRSFLITSLLSFSIACYSQSKEIIGSWLWRNSSNIIQLSINKNGSIEQRSGSLKDDVFNKPPRTGTYTFNTGKLVIKWADKNTENLDVKFTDSFRAAEIKFPALKKKFLFLRVVDEEVTPDK